MLKTLLFKKRILFKYLYISIVRGMAIRPQYKISVECWDLNTPPNF